MREQVVEAGSISTLTNILIIDDDAAFRKIVEMRLRSFLPGLNLIQQDSLSKAREFLKNNKVEFDLVVLDEHLSDGRGVEFLKEGWFQELAVLSVSSDDNPTIPGDILRAGATYFLNKMRVSEPLFRPLVEGIIDRNRLQRELRDVRMQQMKVDTVKTLVATLKHEINNPLGAVLGAAYLLGNTPDATAQQRETAELVEKSGKRIKHVLDELCKAMEVEAVSKADHKVFHIPGDAPWKE